ncbi:hypothetical protein [Psychromarinibacter halotolerans]|uniref:Uncharacterized protein n=1 Tax=Psychromarinibacter halotolerans TaxID=1775175 RepID=A0ABV7GW84_9RHOB|nr:hypothetical protein [Psychromarinibacter halotolerans]MDF0598651.1 hypothetical protein [Psychromarinibacter halotolerans]
MTKKIFAAALAASLALTAATVSPASALDRGETTRLILGVGTLFALGHALNQHNKGRTNVTRNTPPQRYEPPRYHNPPQRYNPPHRHNPPHQRNNVVRVPAHCIHGRGGNRWVDWQCARRAGY